MIRTLTVLVTLLVTAQAADAREPFLEKTDLVEANTGGYAHYRIPGLVVQRVPQRLFQAEASGLVGQVGSEVSPALRADGAPAHSLGGRRDRVAPRPRSRALAELHRPHRAQVARQGVGRHRAGGKLDHKRGRAREGVVRPSRLDAG